MDAEMQDKLRAIAEREAAEGVSGPQVGPTPEAKAAMDALKAPVEAPEPTPTPKKRESVYAVYRSEGDGSTLHLIAPLVTGVNDKAAILEVVNPNEIPGGLGYYVAIAHRSLTPRKVGIVTEPRVVIE